MKKFTFLKKQALLFTMLVTSSFTFAQLTVSTLAGSAGVAGSSDGTGNAASFNNINNIAVDTNGNIYVVDRGNHYIRKITPVGVVTTLAGSGATGNADGIGTAASFNNPIAIAVDATGNVYVADTSNHRIRKITPSGVVTTIAGSTSGFVNGTGTAAKFSFPQGIAVDNTGNIFVGDRDNLRIRKIDATGVVTTFAGSGTYATTNGAGTSASFQTIFGMTIDNSGNIYVSQNDNHVIRKITPSAVVTTFAGTAGSTGSANGTGTTANFNVPCGLACDASGNIYVADRNNHTIRKITPAGEVTTFAGITGASGFNDGSITTAKFQSPLGVGVNTSGIVYVGDTGNNTIRKIAEASLSSEDFEATTKVSVYPNPSNGVFNLEAQNNATVTVFDMLGKQIVTQKITVGTATVNLSSFTAGIYFSKITTENNQTQTVKLIKE